MNNDKSYPKTTDNDTGLLNFASVRIYPDPSHENIFVFLPESAANAVFTIYDLQGQELLRQSIHNGEEISVAVLTAGDYTYIVVTEVKQYDGKLNLVK